MARSAEPSPNVARGQGAVAALAEGIANLRSALEAAADETGGQIDWLACRHALDSLDGVQRGLEAAGGRASSKSRRVIRHGYYLAIIGIERLRALREELEPTSDRQFLDELTRRIRNGGSTIEPGRLNRSSIELTFSADNADAAQQMLCDLRQQLEQPIFLADRRVDLEVAIGFAGDEAGTHGMDALVEHAEHALAAARARNIHVAAFTERDRVERMERLALAKQLRHAVANDELFVCYQPKLCLRTSRIDAVEALVRWRHPVRGLVPPDEFIPLAEEGDEIRALTEFVIRQSVNDREVLSARELPLLINVNISGQLISDEKFTAWALATLAGKQNCFGFEITETAIIANPELALAHIRAFSEAGIAIAIDDYGSGLSSLSYLKQIPAHELKIDKAFVTSLTSNHRDPLLVRSTIDLAHALDMKVTAEGVDNNMSLALLQVMGCDTVQGYHVSKPLVIKDLISFLLDFKTQPYENPLSKGFSLAR